MRVHIPVLLAALLAGALGSPAAAQLNLSWDDCGLAGTELKTWACDANPTVVARFHASFVVTPAMNITALDGAESEIDVWTGGATLPAWWQFQQSGSCRPNGLAFAVNLPCPGALDYFNTVSYPVGGFAYDYGSGFQPYYARLRTAQAIPVDMAGPITTPGEYYAFTITLKGVQTVGAGACGGCREPIGLVLGYFRLYQPPGVGDIVLTQAADRNWIDWQCPGNPVAIGGYPAPGFAFYCATPAHPRTWGQIKSLYR